LVNNSILFREKKKIGIKIETFGDEALFTIEPISKDVKIDEIIKKYKLITYKEYIKRATEVQDDARTK